MKILIFGAAGKIGVKVVSQLTPRHEVIRVGSRSGDIVCDYTDDEMFLVECGVT